MRRPVDTTLPRTVDLHRLQQLPVLGRAGRAGRAVVRPPLGTPHNPGFFPTSAFLPMQEIGYRIPKTPEFGWSGCRIMDESKGLKARVERLVQVSCAGCPASTSGLSG